MQTTNLLEIKINEGKNILQNISHMRRTSGPAINVVYYISEDIEQCRKAMEKWQFTSKDILIDAFGESHRYVLTFADMISKKNSGFNYQREFISEVNQGMSVLESVQESLQMGIGLDKKEEMNASAKNPMIFISHSSKDKPFVEALVSLLEDIGFDKSNLFCSSVDGYGIALSKDIFETLRSLFNEHNLYVIFIHSPRYYKSAVSLNEMGAAWVLKTDFCSFLTADMDFNKMSGVVNGSTIAIKVDTEDVPSRLNELKNLLIQMFSLPLIDETKWERKRNMFLKQVLSIVYDNESAEENTDTIEFSKDELKIFSRWANNSTDSNFISVWTRQGLEVHFGYKNGYIYPRGEALAQYEDYMERLQYAGYIIVDGMVNKLKRYKITKQGYDFAKTLLDL
jgi:hypothetical protein